MTSRRLQWYKWGIRDSETNNPPLKTERDLQISNNDTGIKTKKEIHKEKLALRRRLQPTDSICLVGYSQVGARDLGSTVRGRAVGWWGDGGPEPLSHKEETRRCERVSFQAHRSYQAKMSPLSPCNGYIN